MIPSSISGKGEVLVGTSHYSNWLTFTRTPTNQSDSLRVLAYINIRLSSFCFFLCKDLINHKDILFIFFFNNNICSYIINIYSDASHSALKYLKNTEVSINNLLIMTGDFNIRDSLWDSSFPYHSSISNNLIIIADSFNLELSILTNSVPISVKIVDNGLDFYFYFSFYFILFCFSFIFLFLEQLGLGFISHAVTSVTN